MGRSENCTGSPVPCACNAPAATAGADISGTAAAGTAAVRPPSATATVISNINVAAAYNAAICPVASSAALHPASPSRARPTAPTATPTATPTAAPAAPAAGATPATAIASAAAKVHSLDDISSNSADEPSNSPKPVIVTHISTFQSFSSSSPHDAPDCQPLTDAPEEPIWKVQLTIHPEKNDWCPLSLLSDAQRASTSVYTHRVEYAKTGRARCRKCGLFIDQEALRIGLPMKWPNGLYGYISGWLHV